MGNIEYNNKQDILNDVLPSAENLLPSDFLNGEYILLPLMIIQQSTTSQTRTVCVCDGYNNETVVNRKVIQNRI